MKIKNLNHSKYKNTGLIFELLTQDFAEKLIETQTKDLNNVSSNKIVSTFFQKGTELHKELQVYKMFLEYNSKDTKKVTQRIKESLQKYAKTINYKKLNNEKYKLVKEIKDNFNENTFFDRKIQNYKVLASIYKMLKVVEHPELRENNKKELQQCNHTIMERIKGETKYTNTDLNKFENLDRETRDMSYSVMIDMFKETTKDLKTEQTEILNAYIKPNINTKNTAIKEYAKRCVTSLTNTLEHITDKPTRLKVESIIKELNRVHKQNSQLKENQVSALMLAYDLLYAVDSVIKRKK